VSRITHEIIILHEAVDLRLVDSVWAFVCVCPNLLPRLTAQNYPTWYTDKPLWPWGLTCVAVALAGWSVDTRELLRNDKPATPLIRPFALRKEKGLGLYPSRSFPRKRCACRQKSG